MLVQQCHAVLLALCCCGAWMRARYTRIEQDITVVSQSGFNDIDRGVYRQGFSAANMAAREWLRERFEALVMPFS